MELLFTILSFILTLGILVTIHEFGHFWVARRCGVKVIRFSVGFGKKLYGWHDKHGTEFVIAILPLGGYVKMVDEREATVAEADLPYAFNRKSVGQRIAVVSAGPIANFLLAIVAFWLINLGGISGVIPVVDRVELDSIAANAGLKPGYQILAIDGVETPTRRALSMELFSKLGETAPVDVLVKYLDSNVAENYTLSLDRWMSGVEEPDPIDGLGIELYRPKAQSIIGKVVEDTPAESAGLAAGDILLEADGVVISDWEQWVDYVRSRYEQPIALGYEREGQRRSTIITPRKIEHEGKFIGQVGVWAQPPEWPKEYLTEETYNPVAAMGMAISQTWDISVFTLVALKKMIVGDISAKNLSGPITIAKVAGESASYGIRPYLNLLAMLSISLGVLNLLPVPVLDGGHLLYYIAELIKGSPVSERVQEVGFQFGLLLIVSVMMLAFYNDVMRLM